MRLIRFYHRLKNQYQMHRNLKTIWFVIRVAWVQSKKKGLEHEQISVIDIDNLIK